MTSNFITDYVFNATGNLTLVHCTLRNFVSAPIYVGGQVTVLDSKIRENGKGVFKLMALGGMLRVENTEFERNSANTGAVFFIYPVNGNEATQILVSRSNSEEISLGMQAVSLQPMIRAYFSTSPFQTALSSPTLQSPSK